MGIQDQHVDAMRAMLVGDFDTHWRLVEQIDGGQWADYNTLLVAAFFTAVERRFGPTTSEADVVQFVAHTRSRFDESAGAIDPRIAERLVLAALGMIELGSADDEEMVVRVETALLTELISAENLDDAGLNGFLKDAVALAGQWAQG